jgi:methyl-accepting chemotaxis protein
VIQQNASASEEMASTSEELRTQAEQLQNTIAFFRIDGAGAVVGRARQTVKVQQGRFSKTPAAHLPHADYKKFEGVRVPRAAIAPPDESENGGRGKGAKLDMGAANKDDREDEDFVRY